mmetsp:Transcript_26680/g.89996  ORF Transcript_26680/g.89996 Transcript_26680/m.89996 type:complete len:296 (+) Transcript_26680:39-926(+)
MANAVQPVSLTGRSTNRSGDVVRCDVHILPASVRLRPSPAHFKDLRRIAASSLLHARPPLHGLPPPHVAPCPPKPAQHLLAAHKAGGRGARALPEGKDADRRATRREEGRERGDERVDELLEPCALRRKHDLRRKDVDRTALRLERKQPVERLGGGGAAANRAVRAGPARTAAARGHVRAHIGGERLLRHRSDIRHEHMPACGGGRQAEHAGAGAELEHSAASHELSEPRVALAPQQLHERPRPLPDEPRCRRGDGEVGLKEARVDAIVSVGIATQHRDLVAADGGVLRDHTDMH